MQAMVRVKGYLKVKNFSPTVDGEVFPYLFIHQDEVVILNPSGHAVIIDKEVCEFLS